MSDLIREVNGEPAISLDTFAVLLGKDPKVVRAEYDMQQAVSPGQVFRVPAEWLRDGRRIARETMARLGTDDITAVLEHLTAERGNAS